MYFSEQKKSCFGYNIKSQAQWRGGIDREIVKKTGQHEKKSGRKQDKLNCSAPMLPSTSIFFIFAQKRGRWSNLDILFISKSALPFFLLLHGNTICRSMHHSLLPCLFSCLDDERWWGYMGSYHRGQGDTIIMYHIEDEEEESVIARASALRQKYATRRRKGKKKEKTKMVLGTKKDTSLMQRRALLSL